MRRFRIVLSENKFSANWMRIESDAHFFLLSNPRVGEINKSVSVISTCLNNNKTNKITFNLSFGVRYQHTKHAQQHISQGWNQLQGVLWHVIAVPAKFILAVLQAQFNALKAPCKIIVHVNPYHTLGSCIFRLCCQWTYACMLLCAKLIIFPGESYVHSTIWPICTHSWISLRTSISYCLFQPKIYSHMHSARWNRYIAISSMKCVLLLTNLYGRIREQ